MPKFRKIVINSIINIKIYKKNIFELPNSGYIIGNYFRFLKIKIELMINENDEPLSRKQQRYTSEFRKIITNQVNDQKL